MRVYREVLGYTAGGDGMLSHESLGTMKRNVMKMRSFLMLSVVVFLWGSFFTLPKLGLEEISPVKLAFLRFSLALPFLAAFARIEEKQFLDKSILRDWKTPMLGYTVGYIGGLIAALRQAVEPVSVFTLFYESLGELTPRTKFHVLRTPFMDDQKGGQICLGTRVFG